MSTLRFHLFGKFRLQRDSQLVALDSSKEQELLSYLLVNRGKSHPREALASVLWGDTSTEKSKKYLRQALWHLQAALDSPELMNTRFLLIEHDWVQLNLQSDFWLDVAVFEEAFSTTRDVPGDQLQGPVAEALKEAVALYVGDLLEGWYQDWCLFERERLQNMYLFMLDKLMSYSEKHHEYEAGLAYGSIILSFDRASERTYRRLMELQYMAGDRTGALRQYDRCISALEEELGVKPESRTQVVYQRIRGDGLGQMEPVGGQSPAVPTASLPDVLGRLKRLNGFLAGVQRRVQREIKLIEQGLRTTKR